MKIYFFSRAVAAVVSARQTPARCPLPRSFKFCSKKYYTTIALLLEHERKAFLLELGLRHTRRAF